MGMIAALRFNKTMGAIVSDEGMWNLRFRRKAYLDNIHRLLDDDIAEKTGIEIAYGGSGYPSLHHEIVTKTRLKIRELWDSQWTDGQSSPPFKTVEDISRITLQIMHQVIRRRIDLRLNFFYGFTSDDLLQGTFTTHDESIAIKQDAIKDRALKIAQGEEGGRLSKAWFKSRATTFGYDSERGITGYYLDPEKGVMCYNHEGWDAFGAGKYASGLVMAQYLNRKPLQTRRNGIDPAEGILTLLNAGLTAVETFQETGGTIHIVLIDAAAKSPADQYREIFDDVSVLACEITHAWRWQFITQVKAQHLIHDLIFNRTATPIIEKNLYQCIKNPGAFELALRGYKLDEIPYISARDDIKETEKNGRRD